MDVTNWLRGLGLERYVEAFRDNDIDAEVLPRLTAEDLNGLGVTSIGHRRKLIEAIAALRGGAAPAAEAPADTRPEPAVAPIPVAARSQAERRQLTVMFVDLVGSTALSHRLDPEDMREIIRAYQNAAAGEILRFAGHVAQFMGDGILAYFGWPQAQEDAAERAVRAGLAVTEAVRQLEAPGGAPLAVRVGIATGLVVVGELVGGGVAQEEAVVGETPNLAARLQALAEPGAVVIGPHTRRLVGGAFACADLGARELKGFTEPVPAWRVLGLGTTGSRFEARQAAATPLVGREEELALLLGRWRHARQGKGQVVLLSGEPGIGKSRLIQSLREQLANEGHTALHYQCSPYHTHSVLHPVVERLERAAGFERDDAPELKLDKLEALLAQSRAQVRGAAPLLAALLSIPTGGRYLPLGLTPQRQKELTLCALLDQLEGLAARQPVLGVLEDAHWSDPTTQELFNLVVDRARDLRVLVVITFRPEFRPPWTSHAHLTLVTLDRLSRRQGATLVEQVAGGKPLPVEVVEQIVAKADGVPLFIEELTKTVLESGLLQDAGDRYDLAGPLPSLAIPSSLQDSLLARLDRLAPVKEVAQIGAVIGREFSHELLTAVAPLSNNELQDALAQLAEAELVFRRGAPPSVSYVFKHALVRDAAYQSLLKGRRQQLHAKIVQALERHPTETVETQPEVLARHCTEAGLVEKAVDYWHKAGRQAMARSAMAEAIAQLRQGLELLRDLPGGPARRQELRLQAALGGALIAAEGLAAEGTGKAFARACQLCWELGDTLQLLPVMVGQWSNHISRAEHGAAVEVGEQLLRLAQRQQDIGAQVMAHRAVGTSLLHLGQLDLAIAHLQQALALHDPVLHQSLALRYAYFDPRVAGLTWLSWLLFMRGSPEQAQQRSGEALTRARKLCHVTTMAMGLSRIGNLFQFYRDRDTVLERAEELISIATEHGLPQWLAVGTILRGWAVASGGDAEAGSTQLRRGITAYQTTGSKLWLPYFLALLAEVIGYTGEAAEAPELLTAALTRAEETSERWFEPELHRLKGDLLLRLSQANRSEAEACFQRALAVARGQGAKMWELRAATSLARIRAEQGERRKAHDLLAPVYGWFTEGFDTRDLKDARALLDALN